MRLVTAALLVLSGNVADAADREVHLTVSVSDEEGKAIVGARINIIENPHKASLLFVTPPTYQGESDASGLARIQIKVATGATLTLRIEVSREDMQSERRELDLGTEFPTRLPMEKFTLKKKSEGGSGPIIKVIIAVQSDGVAVEGANVMIRDTSLGAATGKFPGVTGVDGQATINVMYGSASPEETLPVEVSKGGYKNGKISINLRWKQVGQTVVGGTVKLEKVSKDAAKVTVTVLDATNGDKVADATVILDGPKYYSLPTNSDGEAPFLVEESGGYQVRITQDTYREYTDSFRLVPGQKEHPLKYELTPKANKDEGRDKIEVTVLKKDSTDEKSKPSPLPGASVRVGTISTITDANGNATLEGAFAEKQEVTVQATGYKSQSKSVSLGRSYSLSRGKGRATFTLDPDLSENSPIRVIVEVLGPRQGKDKGKEKIEKADVDFYLANGTLIGGNSTKADGTVDFRSSDAPNIPIAELRKGLMVNVKKSPEYKEVINRSVPASMLEPRLEASKFSVELERDWSELEKATATLEGRVAGWKSEAENVNTKAKSVAALSTKCAAARRRSAALLGELKAVRKAADEKRADDGCKEAQELERTTEKWRDEAAEKEKLLRSTLDEAISLAATCSSKAEADAIRAKHKRAIVLTGELGKLEIQARVANKRFTVLAQSFTDAKPLAQLQQFVDKIEEEVSAAGKDAAEADNGFDHALRSSNSLPGRRAELLEVFDELRADHHVREYDEVLPKDLRKRLANLEAALSPTGGDLSMKTVLPLDRTRLNVIKETVSALQEDKNQAVEIVGDYKTATCDVRSFDYTVNAIGQIVVGATIELGAASDLPDKADACAAKAAAVPSPTPTPVSDEITVPDVSGFADPGAMKAAAGPDMVGVIMATKNTPPPGTTKLFASQDPPANSKAKRGSTLKIYIYQSLAAVSSPTPTPTPTPTPSKSPSDEITVPDVSGFNDPGAMKAAAGPNMVGVIMATKNSPPPGTKKLFAYQEPPANSKAKRGSVLKIFIYQSLAAVSSPTPTPTPMPTPTPSPSATPSDEITVPDVSGFSDPKAMKAAAGPDMVGVIMATKNTPPPGSTRLFASQDPPANSKAKRGSTLKIYIYQSLADAGATPSPTASPAAAAVASPSATPTKTGSMPNLIGLTLEQAVTRLPGKTEILSDEIGDKPPTPEKALTIFAQTPAAGTTFDPNKPPIVKVKRYGSAKTADTGSGSFAGTWVGMSLYPTGGDSSGGLSVEMIISKQGSGYVIEVAGVAYPLQSDGTKLWHSVAVPFAKDPPTFGQYDITYRLVGDTLAGDWRLTTPDGTVTTGALTLHRK